MNDRPRMDSAGYRNQSALRRGLLSTLRLMACYRKYPHKWDETRGCGSPNGGGKVEGGQRLSGSLSTAARAPIVTIITVTYNSASTLKATINSVLSQTVKNDIEYIIIDGGSTDGSLGIIRDVDDKIEYWLSEPDAGIYAAMNKGISLARGQWLYFLGSGDVLFDEMMIGAALGAGARDVRLIFGNVVDEKGNVFKSRLDRRIFWYNTVHHQAAFYRRELFDKFRYSTIIPVVGDYELNLRIFLNGYNYRYLDMIAAICPSNGISHAGNDYHNYLDYYLIRSRYVGVVKNSLFFFAGVVGIVRARVIQLLSSISAIFH